MEKYLGKKNLNQDEKFHEVTQYLEKYNRCFYSSNSLSFTYSHFWYCPTCREYVCDYCLFECHNPECLKSSSKPSECFDSYFDGDGGYSITCYCGSEGHLIAKKNNKQVTDSTNQCTLKPLYKNFPQYQYKCLEPSCAGKRYCFICLNTCHKETCDNTKIRKVKDEEDFTCTCKHNNHEDNKFVFSSIAKGNDALKVMTLARIQASSFEHGLLNKYLTAILEQEKNGEKFESTIDSNLWAAIYEIKKGDKHFFYIQKAFKEMYPFETILNTFLKIEKGINAKDFALYFGRRLRMEHAFALGIVYIRDDFRKIKKFTMSYYLNTNITERLKQRYLIRSERNSEQFSKYFEDDETGQKKLIKYVVEMMNVLKVDNRWEMQAGLYRLARNILKTMLFDYGDYEIYLKALFKSEKLEDYLKFYSAVMVFDFNDSILYECLINEDFAENKFLQINKEFSPLFSKLLLNTFQAVFNEFDYENYDFTYKETYKKKFVKRMTKFKEMFKLLTMSENSFSEDFADLKLDEIQRFKNLVENVDKDKSANEFVTLVNNFTKKIDLISESYYFIKINSTTYMNETSNAIREFSESYCAYLDNFNEKNPESEIKNTRHFNRVTKTSKELSFLTHPNLHHHIKSQNYCDLLLITSYIRNIVLIIDAIKNDENSKEKEKLVELVFGMISALTVTKGTTDYLISNNIIKRILLLADKNRSQYLELVYIIVKAMNLHNIELKYNRFIMSLSEDLLKYFLQLNPVEVRSKSESILVSKIFCLISEHIEPGYMKNIKHTIFEHLKNNGFLVSSRFKDSFPSLSNDKYSIGVILDEIGMSGNEGGKRQKNQDLEALNSPDNAKRQKTFAQLAKYQFMQMFSVLKIPVEKIAGQEGGDEDYYGQKANTYIDQKLFFTFFKLIYHNSFFILKNDKFKSCVDFLYDFNDLTYIEELMSKSYISIDKRTILIKYMYSLYFLDVIGDGLTNQNLISASEMSDYERYKKYQELYEKYQKEEFKEAVEKAKGSEELMRELNKDNIDLYKYVLVFKETGYQESYKQLQERMKDIKQYEGKHSFTLKFQHVMNIYIKEFKNMFYWMYSSNCDTKDIDGYVRHLLDLLRYISDYYWDVYKKTNIYSSLISYYYKLAQVFVSNIVNINEILTFMARNPDPTELKQALKAIIMRNSQPRGEDEYITRFKLIEHSFDLPKIYQQVLDGLAFLNIKIMKTDCLTSFFENYDKKNTLDFFTLGLEFEPEFLEFYEGSQQKVEEKKEHTAVDDLTTRYRALFKNIKDLSIFKVLSSLSTDIGIRKSLSNIFIKYFENDIYIDDEFEYFLVHIFTKILFFDTSKYQDILYNILKEKDDELEKKEGDKDAEKDKELEMEVAEKRNKFFRNYYNRSQTCLAIYTASCDKFYVNTKFFHFMNMKSKLMLQFIQLLGEGFYTGFLDKIFNKLEYPKQEGEKFFRLQTYLAIFDYDHVKKIIEHEKETKANELKKLQELEKEGEEEVKPEEEKKEEEENKEEEKKEDEEKKEEEGEEKKEAEKPEEEKKEDEKKEEEKPIEMSTFCIYEHFFNLLIQVNDLLICDKTADADIKYNLSDDGLVILLANITALITEYNGNIVNFTNPKEEDIKNLINTLKNCYKLSDVLFRKESKYENENRRRILLYCKLNCLKLISSCVQPIGSDKGSRESLNKINKIRLFEEMINTLSLYVETLKKKLNLSVRNAYEDLLDLYITDGEFETSNQIKFCIESFKLLMVLSEYTDKEINSYYDSLTQEDIKALRSDELTYDSVAGYNTYKFLKSVVKFVTITNNTTVNEESSEKKIMTVFFVKPPFTFQLTEQTKMKFIENVDRTSATTKLKELVDSTDYFLFEMLNNSSLFKVLPILKILNNIQMYYFELFNYLLVIIHQILLFVKFFRKKDFYNLDNPNLFTFEEKFSSYAPNTILSIIQIVYLGITISIWFIIFASINYQKLLMRDTKLSYLINNRGEKSSKSIKTIRFTKNFLGDNKFLLSGLNDEVELWKKLKIIFLDLILLNREVNFFILDIVLLILYLTTSNSICLVIPVVLITNLSQFLYDIMYVIQLKWQHLCLVLMYTYLLVYLFSWIAFLYYYELFVIESVDIEAVSLYF
jgi:hypothetical protein